MTKGKSKRDVEREVQAIAKRFSEELAAAGMEVTGATTEGTPTISVYVHTDRCASRRGYDCDCREDLPAGLSEEG